MSIRRNTKHSFKHKQADWMVLGDVQSLTGLFQARVKRSSHVIAYQEYNVHKKSWQSYTWQQTADEAARWQMAFLQESLQPGDRVAVMLANSWQWVVFDQAALASGLVVVSLYPNDRPGNVAYILKETGAKLLLIEDLSQWHKLSAALKDLHTLERVLTRQPCPEANHIKLMDLKSWLPQGQYPLEDRVKAATDLATLIYTSGTTGEPKGVMLSHGNLLWNVKGIAQQAAVYPSDHILSFLPLSHAMERTTAYYLAILAGAKTSYARSVNELGEDLRELKPTLMMVVPRVFERFYARLNEALQQQPAWRQRLFALTERIGYQRFQYQQGRGSFAWYYLLWPVLDMLVAKSVRAFVGGQLRMVACGGAPLSPVVAERFISLGIPVLQGYGLTEASPIVSTNLLDDNEPLSVGRPLPGLKIRIGPHDELLVKGPSVMQGYWQQPGATAAALDAEGWLHTGDKAETLEGRLYIIGRLKEIIVLATGEKVSPQAVETAICQDTLFEQCMVIGEGLPFLSCLLVLNAAQWRNLATARGLDAAAASSLSQPKLLEAILVRIGLQLKTFPGYTQVRKTILILEHWTVENGLLTPTLKLRREAIYEHYGTEIDALYQDANRQ